jgi:hypothetical protein
MYYVAVSKKYSFAVYASSEPMNFPDDYMYYQVPVDDSFVFDPPIEGNYWAYDSINDVFEYVGPRPKRPNAVTYAELGVEHPTNKVWYVAFEERYYFVYRQFFFLEQLNSGTPTSLGITTFPHQIENINSTQNYPIKLKANIIDASGIVMPLPTAYGNHLEGHVTAMVDSQYISIITNANMANIQASIQLDYTKSTINDYYFDM